MLLVLVHTAQAKNGDNTKAATAAAAAAAAVMPYANEESTGEWRRRLQEGEGGGYYSGYFLSQRT